MNVPTTAYQTEADRARGGTSAREAPRAKLAAIARGGLAAVDHAFGALSLTVLLAMVVTVPIVGLVALGYMLRAASRVVHKGRLRDAFPGLPEASRLGQIALAGWLLALPVRLLVSLSEDARLVDPSGTRATNLQQGALLALVIALSLFLAGLLSGGRFASFFRPLHAVRTIVRARRQGRAFWPAAQAFVASFALGHAWKIGLKAFLCAALWLVLPTALLATGAGLAVVVGGLALAIVTMYVPFLQMHVVVHDELRRAIKVRDVLELFRRAPLAFGIAGLVTVALALPLYLLKVEVVPRDALWLPSIFFVVLSFPAKVVVAWAYARGARQKMQASPVAVWLARGGLFAVGVAYAVVVFFSPTFGWHGRAGMFEHHAFLVPVPF